MTYQSGAFSKLACKAVGQYLGGGRQVDVVDAHAGAADDLQPAPGRLEHLPSHLHVAEV